MARKSAAKTKGNTHEPTIENRRARHDYQILEKVEVGMKLTGTEIKSIRNGRVSLNEGFVRASDSPPSLTLHNVHISEYPPAGQLQQHEPTRSRTLLAHNREIRKLADQTREKGVTIVPLKIYFVRGMAKLLIGLARGKGKADRRQDIAKRDAERDMARAMSRARK